MISQHRRFELAKILRAIVTTDVHEENPNRSDLLEVIGELELTTCGRIQVRECVAPHNHEGPCEFDIRYEAKS